MGNITKASLFFGGAPEGAKVPRNALWGYVGGHADGMDVCLSALGVPAMPYRIMEGTCRWHEVGAPEGAKVPHNALWGYVGGHANGMRLMCLMVVCV